MKEEIRTNANAPDVPYVVFEGVQTRTERHIKRLWIALIIAIIAVFASNIAWLLYINQYDFAEYDYTQDGRGVNIIGDFNGVDYDGTTSEGSDTNEEEP